MSGRSAPMTPILPERQIKDLATSCYVGQMPPAIQLAKRPGAWWPGSLGHCPGGAPPGLSVWAQIGHADTPCSCTLREEVSNSATPHMFRDTLENIFLLFGSVPGWCISGFVRLDPKSAYADMLTCRASAVCFNWRLIGAGKTSVVVSHTGRSRREYSNGKSFQ